MTIDAIVEPFIFPRPSMVKLDEMEVADRLQATEEDMRTMKKIISKLLQTVTQVVNWQLQLINVGVFYFQLPNPQTGEYADGDVRLRKSAADTVVMEVHDGTDWSNYMAKWRYDE